ncbi:hypothetical protein [Microbulbifer pacificus]|uniref:hypothetical protein n=1 Tax=Microbulbifer pacificus TaxID=407164 RepID=UPI001319E297|nr:hypothetical protein [Microbulbifer pacificus]
MKVAILGKILKALVQKQLFKGESLFVARISAVGVVALLMLVNIWSILLVTEDLLGGRFVAINDVIFGEHEHTMLAILGFAFIFFSLNYGYRDSLSSVEISDQPLSSIYFYIYGLATVVIILGAMLLWI